MHRLLRQRHRLVGSVLLCTVIALLSVTCIAQADMTDAEMACCTRMAGDCGPAMAQEHGCCRTESASLDQQLTPAPRFLLASFNRTDFVVLELPAPRLLPGVQAERHHPDSSPPTSRGIPAYLLLSTLRI